MSTGKNINIVSVLKEGAMLTGLVTAVGWVGDKALGESLSPNPSKSISNFVKMGVNITGCMLLRDWLEQRKYWPDI